MVVRRRRQMTTTRRQTGGSLGDSGYDHPADPYTLRCPLCSSTRLRRARRDERPDHFIALRAWRVCEVCGKCFEPPSRLFVSVLFAAASVALAILTTWLYMVPGFTQLITGRPSVSHGAIRFILGAFATAGFVIWAVTAVRKAKYSRSWARRTTSEAPDDAPSAP